MFINIDEQAFFFNPKIHLNTYIWWFKPNNKIHFDKSSVSL